MKILLCTITIGEGLNRICQATANELEKLNIETEIYNVYKNNSKRQNFNKNFYYKLVKIIPRTLAFFQKRYSNYNRKFYGDKAIRFIKNDVEETKKSLLKKFEENQFDVIYTPIAFIAYAALLLRREKKINAKVVYQLPDFNIPIGTELLTDIDTIITPCSEIANKLKRSGIFTSEQILDFGLPIHERFFKKLEKRELRKNLNIEQDKLCVLIMSGGFGFGKNSALIKKLTKKKPDIHFIVVNGRNEIEKNKIDTLIKKYNYSNVTNYGFCKNVDELMQLSDVVFTKVGSATMCEAYAKNIPIIALTQKLYPEIDNLAYLKTKESIFHVKKVSDLNKLLLKLKGDRNMLTVCKNNFSQIFNPQSAKQIAIAITKMK